MKVTIIGYDPESNSVSVTFEHGGVAIHRAVNAVLTDGEYDAEATAARVDEVARGVEYKIDNGIIVNHVPPQPPVFVEPEAPPLPEPEPFHVPPPMPEPDEE